MLTTLRSADWLIRPQTSFSDAPNSWKPNWRQEKQKELEAIRQELSQRTAWDLEQAERTIRQKRKLLTYFPDDGPLRRELYPKHLQFFQAGKDYRSRLFRAANRIGKTDAAGYETALHLMGIYPDWWEGYRFKEPIEAWAANISWEKVKTVNQNVLCGPPDRPELLGTGMIPADWIVRQNYHGFSTHGIDTVAVRHVTGGTSIIQFKAYTQGRESFESNAKHLIWLDEECPEDIYTACEVRTMTTGGLILLTYTPVLGMTPLTELFDREADRPASDSNPS